MTAAIINTHMLTWARERIGFSLPEFAEKFGVDESRLFEWESGERHMTFIQAMKYAKKAYIPFGYLFLPEPPAEKLPIPDLRVVDGVRPSEPSAELIDLIKLMFQRQEWYKEYLQLNLSEQNPIVGRFTTNSKVMSIVKDMRNELKVDEHPSRGSWEEYYRDLVNKIETAGILVMRQGNLGHHTRPLNVEEFRGFAIADEYAPLIFINHADALGARLFTLIHELCHIWIGQSGISDASTKTHRKEEILCNAVAAEFLVPTDEFEALWNNDLQNWEQNLPSLESHFHVSTWTLARRALTLDFITHDDYNSYIYERQQVVKKGKSSGGPTYYVTKKSQMSKLFSKAVVAEAVNVNLLLRDAGQLLGNVKPSKIKTFAKELEG